MAFGAFLSGLMTGLVASATAGAAVGGYAYRRFVLLERRTRQSERLAELGTLTGGLAHEIKNPLSTVQLNLQLLGEDLDARDPHQQRVINRLQTVQREAGRLRETLDDFLKYAGKMEVDARPIDLHELLEELADFFAPQAQLNRVRVRIRPAEAGPVMANADPKLVQQAVLNLMLNAVQAMGPRGGGELILSTSSAEGRAHVDVIDTAGGIPADVQPNLFDAYYSTKKGGTGLGLAISRRIAREHGGDLTVTSEVGRGSDFRLTLPASQRG
jgi:signal transduction histidine kinase